MSGVRSEGLSDGAVLAIVGGAAGLAGAIWLWGGLAGALFGRGWPTPAPSQLLEVLIRLPTRLGDPARAWPRPARALLPDAPGFYAALCLMAAAGVALLLLVRSSGMLLRVGSAGARWAAAPELRRLRRRAHGPWRPRRARRPWPPPRGPADTRLTLGRRGFSPLYAEHRHALIAFGPPQSGKSAALAIPALLEWRGPAVASSIKTDLLSATLARRARLGRGFIFDPFRLSGQPSSTWSPLTAAGTWDGALEVAWRLAAAGELDHHGVEGGDFWATAAEQRLAPLLFTAARTGAGIEALVRWAYGQGSRELDQALALLTGEATSESELADAHMAYDAVRAFEAQADRTRTSIEATTQALLRAYRFRRVAASARGSEITPDGVLNGASTLYLVGDAKASKLLRPIFLALLGELIDRAYERATAEGGALTQPLLVCLDEAGNVAPLPNLAEIASTAPSHNIQLVSIFHDLSQARSRYGRQAETVINSHRARMLLPGVADLETLRYFAALLGDEEVRETTRTIGAGGSTRSLGSRSRPLVAAEALRQLPDRHALLIYGRIPPVRVRLRMWFEDRALRRLARAT
ncbi:MAG TPA: type IV secretory system conjugative DNA transfer family protein [Solirubrobacteraceae bacterium]|nr:type IV secretory system conjugative DNA transfer family protein [Solirubrobacteraceae bacterium]